jgi:predicted lipoprotein with Yx(FWY)xxD motif
MVRSRRALIPLAVAAAAVATGVAATSDGWIPAPAHAAALKQLELRESEYGRVLFDGRDRALYLFTRDGRNSDCYGDCARVWPPFKAKGRVEAGDGLKQRWVDTVRRRGGARQVTYRGHPLYFYVHDARGEIFCNDVFEFGGRWFVVRRSGAPAD